MHNIHLYCVSFSVMIDIASVDKAIKATRG